MKDKKLSKRCSLCGGIKIEKRWRMCEKCRRIGKLNKRKHRKTPIRELNCVICGRKAKTTHYNKKTCSKKCSKKLEQQKVRRWHKSERGREYIRNKMREYRVSEKGRKQSKEYYKKNREKINTYWRNYMKTYRKTKKYKEYREKNKEKFREYQRRWREKNKLKKNGKKEKRT